MGFFEMFLRFQWEQAEISDRQTESCENEFSSVPFEIKNDNDESFLDDPSLSETKNTNSQTLTDFALPSTQLESYNNLCAMKVIADGASLPLAALLSTLGTANAKELVHRILGDYAERGFSKLRSDYASLRREVRKHAGNKPEFDNAFRLRNEVYPHVVTQGVANDAPSPVLLFGQYPQKADGKDRTPIEWMVLRKKDGKALIISKKALDCQQFNTGWGDVTWETSTLRKWLNGSFFHKSFSEDEQLRICCEEIPAVHNPQYSTSPGKATKDKVFLLSINEAEELFPDDAARKCAATAYSIAHGAAVSNAYLTTTGESCCWWLLRSPGSGNSSVAYIFYNGSVNYHGGNSSSNRECVRPAMWINLDGL